MIRRVFLIIVRLDYFEVVRLGCKVEHRFELTVISVGVGKGFGDHVLFGFCGRIVKGGRCSVVPLEVAVVLVEASMTV